MKRHILIYGLIGGITIALLKWTEYRFLVVEHSIEIYGGLIAATFAGLGIWLGLKLTTKGVVLKEVEVHVPVPVGQPFSPNPKKQEELRITPRELEILELIAQGLSNREIAQKLFVSENTVKTHSSRVFSVGAEAIRQDAVPATAQLALCCSRLYHRLYRLNAHPSAQCVCLYAAAGRMSGHPRHPLPQ